MGTMVQQYKLDEASVRGARFRDHGPLVKNNVDLLVLTKQGFWLVECKAWEGRITGDSGSWTRTGGGMPRSEDNPVILANRKAKALSSLLKAQSASEKVKLPWLDALVFLSADDVQVGIVKVFSCEGIVRIQLGGDAKLLDRVVPFPVHRVGVSQVVMRPGLRG